MLWIWPRSLVRFMKAICLFETSNENLGCRLTLELFYYLGLEHRSDTGEAMSIIKDDEYVFNTSKWTIVTIIKVLARYGFDMNRLDSIVGKLLDRFSK